mmetsp:Transcript_12669/g.29427  ORF Transcript_12669/g.29427 Transcript_12669/m.29427 type:complete len:139 (-) Transcript_12669:1802-2218(-)
MIKKFRRGSTKCANIRAAVEEEGAAETATVEISVGEMFVTTIVVEIAIAVVDMGAEDMVEEVADTEVEVEAVDTEAEVVDTEVEATVEEEVEVEVADTEEVEATVVGEAETLGLGPGSSRFRAQPLVICAVSSPCVCD